MQKSKKYMIRFWIGMGLYVVVLFACFGTLDRMGQTPLAYIVALLPTVPALYGMVNLFQLVRGGDELEHTIQFESVMITAFLAILFAFTWGLLEYADLVPNMPTFLFAPGMIAAWGIVQGIVRSRYI